MSDLFMKHIAQGLRERIAELEASVEAEIEARAQAQMAEAHYACELAKVRAERDDARKLCRASWFAFLHGDSDDLDALEKAVKQWGKIK